MSDTHWYVAEIVVRFDVEGQPEALVHVNTVLISAPSDDAAYDKAVARGESESREYTNTDGRSVRVQFVGLRNLFYVYDGLDDGSELLYEEFTGLQDEQIGRLSTPKEALAVFSARRAEEPA